MSDLISKDEVVKIIVNHCKGSNYATLGIHAQLSYLITQMPVKPFDDDFDKWLTEQLRQSSELVDVKASLNDRNDEITRLKDVNTELVEALENWLKLIKYQYSGSKEAMNELQYCDLETSALLAKIAKAKGME